MWAPRNVVQRKPYRAFQCSKASRSPYLRTPRDAPVFPVLMPPAFTIESTNNAAHLERTPGRQLIECKSAPNGTLIDYRNIKPMPSVKLDVEDPDIMSRCQHWKYQDSPDITGTFIPGSSGMSFIGS